MPRSWRRLEFERGAVAMSAKISPIWAIEIASLSVYQVDISNAENR